MNALPISVRNYCQEVDILSSFGLFAALFGPPKVRATAIYELTQKHIMPIYPCVQKMDICKERS